MAGRALPRVEAEEALAPAIAATAWIDTHEHLVDERHRLGADPYRFEGFDGEDLIPADFTALLCLYGRFDLVSAGLGAERARELIDEEAEPLAKWEVIAPFMEASRQTGYLREVDLSTERLTGLRLDAETVEEIDARLRELRRPGFYREVLNEVAGVEHCQVNSLDFDPFNESDDPDLLRQDLSLIPLLFGRHERAEELAGIEPRTLDEYLALVEWCFAAYAPRAVAVKCVWAYWRPLAVNAPPRPPAAEFGKLRRDTASAAERRAVEDFLFLRCLELAEAHGLPVKIHLGSFAGNDRPGLQWAPDHVADMVPIVRSHPGVLFVLMHTAWPQSEQLLALAKHFPNVTLDLSWAWSLSPLGTIEFVRRFLTVVPANKLLCFGADQLVVETVVGHAELARRGLREALASLVADGWLRLEDALDLVPRLMRGNAEALFGR